MTEFLDPAATDADPGADPGAEVVTLADGGRILIRPLLPTDRDELAERYLELSPEARRLRFFNAPEHLSDRLLDYLMDVDGPDRCALVAFALDHEETPGVGLARYVRSRDEPECAEWENRQLLDGLRAFGAEVAPSEPGVASVRIALPEPDVAVPESDLHRALRIFAERVDDLVGLRFER